MPSVDRFTGATGAMTTPFLDVLCVGGASIVVAVAVLLWDIRVPLQATAAMVVVGFMINGPHFLASYRLLYGAKDRRLGYRGVSTYMPLVLLLYMLFAIAVFPHNPVYLGAMVGTGVVLLAWHYTGQAWGMMASFAFIAGRNFTTLERRLTRANLYVLLGWHVVWALVVSRRLFEDPGAETWWINGAFARSFYEFATVLAIASSALSLGALALQSRRLGRFPTVRMLVPWVALNLWYVLLYRDPANIFWVQNAHALQYLIFPLRVEMNRKQVQAPAKHPLALRGHMVWYYVGTVLLGVLILQIIPEGIQVGFGFAGMNEYAMRMPGGGPIQLAVVAFVNVHHYFIDNAIWKIRIPAVRQSLFGHLQQQR